MINLSLAIEMDVTNISLLIIPLGITTIQSGIKLREAHSDFVTKFTNGSLYALLGIILAFMKVLSFDSVTLHFFGKYCMGGFEFAACFFVLMALLLMIHYLIIDLVNNKFLRSSVSVFILLIALVPSYFILFYNYYLI